MLTVSSMVPLDVFPSAHLVEGVLGGLVHMALLLVQWCVRMGSQCGNRNTGGDSRFSCKHRERTQKLRRSQHGERRWIQVTWWLSNVELGKSGDKQIEHFVFKWCTEIQTIIFLSCSKYWLMVVAGWLWWCGPEVMFVFRPFRLVSGFLEPFLFLCFFPSLQAVGFRTAAQASPGFLRRRQYQISSLQRTAQYAVLRLKEVAETHLNKGKWELPRSSLLCGLLEMLVRELRF